ncbi:hypothetical protein GY45DRAFT_817360 [Cubamyces sp. BRFM 1775]|nr:hypothetical protein GY45DRAFT_817360 [Cubamyces sp. BRFM 1775]
MLLRRLIILPRIPLPHIPPPSTVNLRPPVKIKFPTPLLTSPAPLTSRLRTSLVVTDHLAHIQGLRRLDPLHTPSCTQLVVTFHRLACMLHLHPASFQIISLYRRPSFTMHHLPLATPASAPPHLHPNCIFTYSRTHVPPTHTSPSTCPSSRTLSSSCLPTFTSATPVAATRTTTTRLHVLGVSFRVHVPPVSVCSLFVPTAGVAVSVVVSPHATRLRAFIVCVCSVEVRSCSSRAGYESRGVFGAQVRCPVNRVRSSWRTHIGRCTPLFGDNDYVVLL